MARLPNRDWRFRHQKRYPPTIPGVELIVVIVSVANVLIFAGMAAWLWLSVKNRKGEALRLAAGLAAIAMAGVAVGSASRAFVKTIQQGWVSLSSSSAAVVNVTQITVGLATVITGIAIAVVLRRNKDRLIGVATTLDVVSARSSSIDPEKWNLTPRQTEVLAAIVDGAVTNEELAAVLFISKHTAGTHVKQILHKTGVSSRRDLALLAPSLNQLKDH